LRNTTNYYDDFMFDFFVWEETNLSIEITIKLQFYENQLIQFLNSTLFKVQKPLNNIFNVSSIFLFIVQ